MKGQHNNLSSVILRAVFESTVLKKECQKPLVDAKSSHSLIDIDRFDAYRLQELIADRMEYAEFECVNHINTYINSLVSDKKQVDFFEIVRDFADNLITRMNGRYCFRYEFTDIWINTVRSL